MVVGEFTQETDVAVIGGGPGGVTTALRVRELGHDVTLIDARERLGGTNLHSGSLPTNILLRLVRTIRDGTYALKYGVRIAVPEIDLDQLRDTIAGVIREEADHLAEVCHDHRVDCIRGCARFEDSRDLHVTQGSVPRVRFRRAVVAVGAKDLPLEAAIESPRVLTISRALTIPSLPSTMLVVGGGTTAIEIATIYSGLGAEVTMIDRAERLVPKADPDVIAPLLRQLDRVFAGVHTGTEVASMTETDEGIAVQFAGAAPPARTTFDAVLIAVGRSPATAGLGLENTGAELEPDGAVRVNEQMRTVDPRIFAVGDATGHPMMSHSAMQQGRVCAEVIAGWASAYEPRAVPYVVYTDPQVAWCGLTEQRAQELGQEIGIARSHFSWTGRVCGAESAIGMTKIIYDPASKLILGMGMAGPHAAEMIAEGALAVEMGAVTTDLAATLHPHPTLSESISRSVMQIETYEPT